MTWFRSCTVRSDLRKKAPPLCVRIPLTDEPPAETAARTDFVLRTVLMAASGQGVAVGLAPVCTFTVGPVSIDSTKRASVTTYGVSAACAAEDAKIIESFPSGHCKEESSTSSTMLFCSQDNTFRKFDYTSADCSGTAIEADPSNCVDVGNGGKIGYSCEQPAYAGMWWVASIGDQSCNGNVRTAIKSGFCRDDGAVATCNADGSYENKEDCNTDCSVCDTTEIVPVISCMQVPETGTTNFFDLRCTMGSETVGEALAMPRAEPSGDAGGNSDSDSGECAEGAVIESGDATVCLPTCANKMATANCIDEIQYTFKDIPDVAVVVGAGTPCVYAEASCLSLANWSLPLVLLVSPSTNVGD